jgi:hypothetical protein
MDAAHKAPAGEASLSARPPRDPQVDLEELLFTLEICRRALPWDAHHAHFDRLRRIEGMVRWSLEQGERNAGHRRLGGGQGGAGGAHVG